MSSDNNWTKVPEFEYDEWFSPERTKRLEGFLRYRGAVPDPADGNEPRWVHVIEDDEGRKFAVREYARLIPRLLSFGIGTRVAIEALERVRWSDGRRGEWRWDIQVQKSPFSTPDRGGTGSAAGAGRDQQEDLHGRDGHGGGEGGGGDDEDELPF